MPKDWFDDYGDPENRATIVKRELAKVGLSLETKDVLGGAPESPEVEARKAAEAKQRLARHDERWGVTIGCTIPGYKIPRPIATAGDADGDRDVS